MGAPSAGGTARGTPRQPAGRFVSWQPKSSQFRRNVKRSGQPRDASADDRDGLSALKQSLKILFTFILKLVGFEINNLPVQFGS